MILGLSHQVMSAPFYVIYGEWVFLTSLCNTDTLLESIGLTSLFEPTEDATQIHTKIVQSSIFRPVCTLTLCFPIPKNVTG